MDSRNTVYDLMKAFGIILMMLAHLVFDTGLPKQIIHSFHMPLFLLLGGMFAKDIHKISSFVEYTKKNARRLLLPYLVTMLMLCAWCVIKSYLKQDSSSLIAALLSMITMSGDGWETQWGLVYAGPMWYLVALFWLRELFYAIQWIFRSIGEKYRDLIILSFSILLSVIIVLIRPYIPSLPFSFLQACTALSFYALGWYVAKHPVPQWVYVLCVLAWPLAIMYGGVGIDSCTIRCYPLSFIGACGGTIVLYYICSLINKICSTYAVLGTVQRVLLWFGIYSLPILCMHQFEMYSDIMNHIVIRLPIVYHPIWGGVIAIALAYAVIKIPILRNVYK